jgi:hypothetical protein
LIVSVVSFILSCSSADPSKKNRNISGYKNAAVSDAAHLVHLLFLWQGVPQDAMVGGITDPN